MIIIASVRTLLNEVLSLGAIDFKCAITQENKLDYDLWIYVPVCVYIIFPYMLKKYKKTDNPAVA